MKRMETILNEKYDNHILPFLWMHGEDERVLRDYMEKIEKSNIHAVCVEARPHPEFVQEQWWKDMDILLDEAKKRNMKMWILDDSHFPTGFANGAVKERFPQYRKRFLKLHQLDFAGPVKYAQAILSHAFSDEDDKIIGVYLAKKVGYEEIDSSTITDITDQVKDNKTVSFSLPEGEWKILVLFSTWKGGEECTEDYLNPIVPEATDVLLQEVYEPHYAHFKEEFGKTICGFFSDEPRFGNMHGPLGSIGRYPMVLPWREDLAELLAVQMNEETEAVKRRLPLLFVAGGDTANEMRYAYMNLVSELYAEHFSKRIGDWCHAHGVEYIGHTIEDNNASARLGYGAGHFFKAMRGQDMAGIDVVLHQLMPGMDHGYNKAVTSNGWDGEFFHYVLGKLGASLGHLDETKKGRVMCEVFGAYGWSEGNRLMKWITDYMLVRGVNEFVPHAFDPKEFPDFDCPPHFYAHGKNPQFEDFGILMKYMNRMSHLLSGGVHHAPVAVLYHGEAEWSGEYMLEQKPCAVLTRNQIDFDIVSQEMCVKSEISTKGMTINQETFRALVVPYAEALPKAFLEKITVAARQGFAVYMIDRLPKKCSEGDDVSQILLELENVVKVVSLDNLVEQLRKDGQFEVMTSSYEPYLRYYHYEQPDGDIWMFVNEAVAGTIETDVMLPVNETLYRYDAFDNTLAKVCVDSKLSLSLEAYESAVYVVPKKAQYDVDEIQVCEQLSNEIILNHDYRVSFASKDFHVFEEEMQLEELIPIQMLKGKENFSGVIRYDKTFSLDEVTERTIISIEGVYESARVCVNGKKTQVRICPPYIYDVTSEVTKGNNTLSIEVTTTLGRQQKDYLSQFMVLEPLGITESVTVKQYRK